MQFTKYKKPFILGILFFLPVIFLLFLYPSTHNYNALEVVRENVQDITELRSEENTEVKLESFISVVAFLGKTPNQNGIAPLNLKELIYDKFRGFKRFQVVAVVHESAETSVEALKKELMQYEPLKYWHFVYGNDQEIKDVYNSLETKGSLNNNLATDEVFIVDKELNQRGRIDDRTKTEVKENVAVYGLPSYNCLEVAELKNKMSEDMRILFTEYRQKRKGNFNSTTRRAQDLKTNEKE